MLRALEQFLNRPKVFETVDIDRYLGIGAQNAAAYEPGELIGTPFDFSDA